MSEPSIEDIVERLDKFLAVENDDWIDDIIDEDEMRALISDWRKKKEALAPFARHAELMNREFADHNDSVIAAGFVENPITFGDFRRALAAYKGAR